MKKILALLTILIFGLSFYLSGFGKPKLTAETSSTKSPQPFSSQLQLTALQTQLAALSIKGRAPKTGYSRELFGPAWADVNQNGCDTRNDILTRDLTYVIYRAGTQNCVVESGNFYDPYTATQLEFVKTVNSSEIEIDHIVSLSDAWQKGAQKWNSELLRQFANDPLNLVATTKNANRQKSDSDAASWLPPNKEIRCAFVARQIAVKSAYQLWISQAEFDAMQKVLSSCPNQPIATAGML